MLSLITPFQVLSAAIAGAAAIRTAAANNVNVFCMSKNLLNDE
jgi:hypothetical protein